MERRYLVASLAIVVTFATLSSGFKSLQQLSQQRGQHPSTLSRWAAELKTHLHPLAAEEAQMLAEMNLPPAPAQARVAEQAIQQSVAAARCARETARRQAERAKRDAERMQEQIARQTRITASSPLSIDLKGLDGLDQRIQIRTAAIVRRFAVQNARMQIAAAKLQAVSMQMQNAGQRRSHCNGRADER
jgi:hypothetical protein